MPLHFTFKKVYEVLHEVFEKVLYSILLIKGRETERPLTSSQKCCYTKQISQKNKTESCENVLFKGAFLFSKMNKCKIEMIVYKITL